MTVPRQAQRARFVLTPVGSAGDVLPFVGVGRRLRERGHEVVLMASEMFRRVVEGAGLEFISAWPTESYEEVIQNPDLWHPRRGLRLVLGTVTGGMRRGYEILREHCASERVVVVAGALAFASRVFHETHRSPLVTLQLAPNAFRSDFEQPALTPGKDLTRVPRWVKHALWWVLDRRFVDRYIEPELNAWRAELGLPPVCRAFKEWFHSPQRVIAMFPDWFGAPQPDWPDQTRQTGFALFDGAAGSLSDPELSRFMDGGEPPMVFTPGTAHRHARAFFEAGLEAAARLGKRALFLTQYAEQVPRPLPDHAHHAQYAPFSLILPRCAAFVHHGGVGTCAQGLAAGIPQLVMPMAFDQPDNATRLARLGVGNWVTVRELSPDRMAAKLRKLLGSPETIKACQRYRDRIRTTQALDPTCDLIEDLSRE